MGHGRRHIAGQEKLLQVALLIAGQLQRVTLPDFAKELDLRVRQIVRHFIASGSTSGAIALRTTVCRAIKPR